MSVRDNRCAPQDNLCEPQDNRCAPTRITFVHPSHFWTAGVKSMQCHIFPVSAGVKRGILTYVGRRPTGTIIQQSSQFFLNFSLCPSFFDPSFNLAKTFQTKRTRRLACLPSFCELVYIPIRVFVTALVWVPFTRLMFTYCGLANVSTSVTCKLETNC